MKRVLAALVMVALSVLGVRAEGIPVDEGKWKALTDQERLMIENILKENRLLPQGDQLVAGPSEPGDAAAWNPGKDLCKTACDVSAAAAASACSGSAVAVAACVIAVDAARKHCRKRC